MFGSSVHVTTACCPWLWALALFALQQRTATGEFTALIPRSVSVMSHLVLIGTLLSSVEDTKGDLVASILLQIPSCV